MRFLQNALFVSCLLLFAALTNYEVVAKSYELGGTALPGWQEACRVEQRTCFHRTTGLEIVDMVLHEGREALDWYATMIA